MVVGDLNTLDSDKVLEEFLEERNLHNLIKSSTLKASKTPSRFQSSMIISNAGQAFQVLLLK